MLSSGFKSLTINAGKRKELHNLTSSPNIWVIKAMCMRYLGQVVSTGKIRNAYRILAKTPQNKITLKPGTEERKRLK
jgi:hypothetical protein